MRNIHIRIDFHIPVGCVYIINLEIVICKSVRCIFYCRSEFCEIRNSAVGIYGGNPCFSVGIFNCYFRSMICIVKPCRKSGNSAYVRVIFNTSVNYNSCLYASGKFSLQACAGKIKLNIRPVPVCIFFIAYALPSSVIGKSSVRSRYFLSPAHIAER